MNRQKVFWVLGLAFALVALVAAGWKGVEASSTNQFCGSCHVMQGNYESAYHSVHRPPDVNCKDCHLPNDNVVKMLGYKAYSGLKDVMVNAVGPPEVIRATSAGKKIIQANCARCHAALVQKVSKTNDRFCFDCHRGIPHGNSGL